jgi:hypothetical protein
MTDDLSEHETAINSPNASCDLAVTHLITVALSIQTKEQSEPELESGGESNQG